MANPVQIQQLKKAIEGLYQQIGIASDQQIYAKFDRTLFSDDFEIFAFYQQEIQYTLQQLEQLSDIQAEQETFLSEKLAAQCTALAEAVNRSKQKNTRQSQSAVNSQRNLSKSEKAKQDIHKLPPRERLVKYYEALDALNNKLIEQENVLLTCQTTEQKVQYSNLISITQQRKNRCLEAIELLEEYLAFTAEKM